MVTLRQIAERAGVSIGTVSMILRNQPGFTAKNREKVLQAAAELGWTKNSQVSALMRHIRGSRKVSTRDTLGLLMAHPVKDARKVYYTVDSIFCGMEQRAHERGYQTEFFWYNDPQITPARLFAILKARGIRGVAIVPFDQFDIIDMNWEDFCVVRVGGALNHPPVHHIVDDYFGNLTTVLAHLWASGYRRIALAWPSYQARRAYYLLTSAHTKFLSDFAAKESKGLKNYISADWSKQSVLNWMKRQKPDAVVTYNWELLLWLREAGYDIPGQIGVTVMNHHHNSSNFSGVDPLPEQLGVMAIDQLVEQVECNETGLPRHAKIVTIRGEWIEGETTRKQVDSLPIDIDILCYPPDRHQ